jgi:hypothetical protein
MSDACFPQIQRIGEAHCRTNHENRLPGTGWSLRGINVLPGGILSGQAEWAVRSSMAVPAGIGFPMFAERRNGAPTEKRNRPDLGQERRSWAPQRSKLFHRNGSSE